MVLLAQALDSVPDAKASTGNADMHVCMPDMPRSLQAILYDLISDNKSVEQKKKVVAFWPMEAHTSSPGGF
jgi:hypothetical protein